MPGPELQPGGKVRLEGLKSAPALNGERGVLEAFITATGRWRVKLDKGETKDLKPDNIKSTDIPVAGAKVQLHSLKATGLNGLSGTVDSFVEVTGRWRIILDNGEGTKDLRPENIAVIDADAEKVCPPQRNSADIEELRVVRETPGAMNTNVDEEHIASGEDSPLPQPSLPKWVCPNCDEYNNATRNVCNCCNKKWEPPNLPIPKVLEMQQDLLKEYAAEAFQRRLDEALSSGANFPKVRFEMCIEVQQRIGAKYGFLATPEGTIAMMRTFDACGQSLGEEQAQEFHGASETIDWLLKKHQVPPPGPRKKAGVQPVATSVEKPLEAGSAPSRQPPSGDPIGPASTPPRTQEDNVDQRTLLGPLEFSGIIDAMTPHLPGWEESERVPVGFQLRWVSPLRGEWYQPEGSPGCKYIVVQAEDDTTLEEVTPQGSLFGKFESRGYWYIADLLPKGQGRRALAKKIRARYLHRENMLLMQFWEDDYWGNEIYLHTLDATAKAVAEQAAPDASGRPSASGTEALSMEEILARLDEEERAEQLASPGGADCLSPGSAGSAPAPQGKVPAKAKEPVPASAPKQAVGSITKGVSQVRVASSKSSNQQASSSSSEIPVVSKAKDEKSLALAQATRPPYLGPMQAGNMYLLSHKDERLLKQEFKKLGKELPQENVIWDRRELFIYLQSEGRCDPSDLAARRRPSSSSDTSPRVSVIVPTTDSRHRFHKQMWSCFLAQNWPNKELIVFETYVDEPSAFFDEKQYGEDSRVIYLAIRVEKGKDLSIGLKRNVCIQMTSGTYIANFDDDDLYAPAYLDTMVSAMKKMNAPAVTLRSWFVHDVRGGIWGDFDPQKVHADDLQVDENIFGYGFSYVYTRESALRMPYPNINMGEDYEFMTAVRIKNARLKMQRARVARVPEEIQLNCLDAAGVVLVYDTTGICLHIIHSNSTSDCWVHRHLMRAEIQALEVTALGENFSKYLDQPKPSGQREQHASVDDRSAAAAVCHNIVARVCARLR